MILLTTDLDRLFGLDAQLLGDLVIQLIAIFVLFMALSYLVLNPARELIKKRQDRIREDMENAQKANVEADKLKAEYTDKLAGVNKEADAILSETRKKALMKENEIIDDAKAEASRILKRAEKEAELEKNKMKDEVKQEMIAVASVMAGKIVASSLDASQQNSLIEETLKEMGDETWQN